MKIYLISFPKNATHGAALIAAPSEEIAKKQAQLEYNTKNSSTIDLEDLVIEDTFEQPVETKTLYFQDWGPDWYDSEEE